jgi:hypothetical protein
MNYTNNGYMDALFGFYFDNFSTSSGLNSEAASFDNENTIECEGQCLVWATNIVNPGWVDIDNDLGMASFVGNNVDLSDTTVLLEGGLTAGFANVNSLDNGIGTDTKGDWQPNIALAATFAQSSDFNTTLFRAPGFDLLTVDPSLPYFTTEAQSTNTTVYRFAFVENDNPNTPYNVYFGAPPPGVGAGFITIEWTGVYTNYATGLLQTNYLYLNDTPEPIITNGEKVVGGVPNNYVITGSATRLETGTPTPTGYQDVFNFGVVTDNYSYVEAQFLGTTVSTNTVIGTNVSAIAGRVDISGSQDVNLNQAIFTGENYVKIDATNQFDGTGGAAIATPFADIAIGLTNQTLNLNFSNILQCATPVWSGTIQAWTTRWTNTAAGLNSDYRVELVDADIFPQSSAQVQNLTLLDTNGVILSDSLNIYGSMYINAQSLTLTTNIMGAGAFSPEGTLNLENNNVLWPSALPNLHWLTNNGTINIRNLANFGTAAPIYLTNVTAAIIGASATATLSGGTGTTNGLAAHSVTIGTSTYTFVNKLTNTAPNQISVAATYSGTMSNLIAAINHTLGSGTVYSTNTSTNQFVTAGLFTNNTFRITSITNGTIGDSIAAATTSTNLFWSASTNLLVNALTLAGGTNAVPAITNVVPQSGPYGAFVNSGLISDDGSQIYASYFENSGIFDDGVGSFVLNSTTVELTNGEIFAYFPFPPLFTNGLNGNISITADTLVASNVEMAAGGGLIFNVTNLLTDTGVTNGNLWFSDGGSALTGLQMPMKPVAGDLLGTTIELITPPPNKPVKNIWSGQDFGVSTSGYTNNEAIGQLILDVPTAGSSFSFAGVTNDNAMYVDRLVLEEYAALTNNLGNVQISALSFNTNLVIYYADAISSGQDVSYIINGFNHNHLIWVPQYVGHFSSTNILTSNGQTNTINAGLAQDPNLDSNGNGIPNSQDPDPLFESSQVNFKFAITNMPTTIERLSWDSIPSATNIVYYSPMLMTNIWTGVYTNISPSAVPPVGGWPITNIIYEPLHMTSPHGYYRVVVSPNSSDAYGQ